VGLPILDKTPAGLRRRKMIVDIPTIGQEKGVAAKDMEDGVLYVREAELTSGREPAFVVIKDGPRCFLIGKSGINIRPLSEINCLYLPYPGKVTLQNREG
jgi:hypothetical protein